MNNQTKRILLGIITLAEGNEVLLRNRLHQTEDELSKVRQDYNELKNKNINPNPLLPYVYDTNEISVAVILCRENPENKMQAIKMFRERFGSDLKRAKDLIDAIMDYNTGL